MENINQNTIFLTSQDCARKNNQNTQNLTHYIQKNYQNIYSNDCNDNINQIIDSFLTLDNNYSSINDEKIQSKQVSNTQSEISNQEAFTNINKNWSYFNMESNQNKNEEKNDLNLQDFKQANQTKNVPKNFLKAIFTFIQYENILLKRLFGHKKTGTSLSIFLDFIKQQKKIKKYTIHRLQSLWMHEQFGMIMRVISSQFLRKRSLSYITGSKILNKFGHMKYKQILLNSLNDPMSFTSFK